MIRHPAGADGSGQRGIRPAHRLFPERGHLPGAPGDVRGPPAVTLPELRHRAGGARQRAPGVLAGPAGPVPLLPGPHLPSLPPGRAGHRPGLCRCGLVGRVLVAAGPALVVVAATIAAAGIDADGLPVPWSVVAAAGIGALALVAVAGAAGARPDRWAAVRGGPGRPSSGARPRAHPGRHSQPAALGWSAAGCGGGRLAGGWVLV